MGIADLIIMILQIGSSLLAGNQIGGKPVDTADKILKIISVAKKAYEVEVGQPLDESKVPKFEEII
jgi:hypothetical protein